MKVHIVLWDDGHIVPKMSQWLVKSNGWTMSDWPEPNVDINYYMPYLQFDVNNCPDTLTAGWFTHYEEGSKWKMQKWHRASSYIDAPCVTAPMYCADRYALRAAQVVTPGVDGDRFVPIDRLPNRKPVVGIAGVGQPRKGPHLICDLFYSDIRVDLQLTGANWPFPHTTLGDDEMPAWFNQLDVYLCTSTIEGIPAPVLEALACDVKVVIPSGVGICDQLPEMEGIRHYRKGDSKDMIDAIKKVLEDKPSKGALRDVTIGYSVDEWCKSNQMAMEVLFNAPVPV